MGITAGTVLDVSFTDGHIVIDVVPTPMRVERAGDGFPSLVADGELPPLSDDEVRSALEAGRR